MHTKWTAQRLRALRKRLGLKQADFAARLRTPVGTYRDWEYGVYRVPGVATLALEQLESEINERELQSA